jgi:hypothetical protein
MNLAALKRWQWACIGVALGLAFSLWRGWVGPEGTLVDRPTLEAVDFERLLLAKGGNAQPMIRKIRVHSRVDGVYWLTAEQLMRPSKKSNQEQYVPVKIPAKTPFVPKTNPPPPANAGQQYTIVDWLRTMQSKHPQIGFSTRWWAQEPVRSPMYAFFGLVLCAGVCPPLVWKLSGVTPQQREQMEKQKELEKAKKAAYDLSRFGKGKPEKKAAKPGITAQDLQHVRELDAELERQLSAGSASAAAAGQSVSSAGAGGGAGGGGATPNPGAPVQKLTGGPLEASADDKPKKPKRFGGEFYPTETHVKQEDDDKNKR